MYHIHATEVAYGTLIAHRLIDARVRGERASWDREIASHDDRSDYVQLAFYLIFLTLSDVPEPPDYLGKAWSKHTVLSSADGETAKAAAKLIGGASDIATWAYTWEWEKAWKTANDETLWETTGLVVRTWQLAAGDRRSSIRQLHASISSIQKRGWRRRMHCARRYYRWTLKRIRINFYLRSIPDPKNPFPWQYPWVQYSAKRRVIWFKWFIWVCSALGKSVIASIQRNRALDNPIIPTFCDDGTASAVPRSLA